MEKFFLRSRGLWGAMIPLIVAAAGIYGLDTENLAGDLTELGTSVALLVGGVLALRSRFRPDGAKLTPAGSGSLVLLLAAWLTLGCGTGFTLDLGCQKWQLDAEGNPVCVGGSPDEEGAGEQADTASEP